MLFRLTLVHGALLVLAGLAAGCRDPFKQPAWESGAVITEADSIDAVAVDDSGVYFITGGHQAAENALRVAPLAGGPSRVLAKGGAVLFAGGVAVDATHVYVATQFDGQILRVAKAGGALEKVTDAAIGAGQMAVDEGSVYFLQFSKISGALRKVPKAGGPAVELATGIRGGDSLFATKTHLYWTAREGIFSVPKAGGPATLEVPPSPLGSALQVAADATHLYFAVDPARSKLYRRPLAGGPAEVLSPSINGNAPIRVLGGQLYFTDNQGSSGTAVKRIPVAGGAPVSLGAGYLHSYDVHGSGVYVNTRFNVVRLGL